MNEVDRNIPYYSYVSSLAGFDPVRTIYLCPPKEEARNRNSAERFAELTGWKRICEEAGAVLVMPIAPNGWETLPADLIQRLYRESANRFQTRSGKAIWGRDGKLWCWETLLYLVGYDDGADFAARTLIRCPNVFAGVALINGAIRDISDGDLASDHWFVKSVDRSYSRKNREIPICLWIFGEKSAATEKMIEHFSAAIGKENQTEYIRDLHGLKWAASGNPAHQVRFFEGKFGKESRLSEIIYQECFERVIRWKNGPDGTLTLADSRDDFYRSPRFLQRSMTVDSDNYDYMIHIPEGLTPIDIAGLPIVFTLHGRGEPAWLFTAKNGWDRLADETREFVLISPDSPGNIWFIERDGKALLQILKATLAEFRLDPERVYLTGFSNGGMFAREMGIRFPEYFAAISPWNAPCFDTIEMRKTDSNCMMESFGVEFKRILEAFAGSGFEMPCFYIYGDNDPAANTEQNLTIDTLLKANGCGPRRDSEKPGEYPANDIPADKNPYQSANGYREGERFDTYAYIGRDGAVRVAVTIMKNMPHGAIHDEARATWAFLKKFRRINGEREVRITDSLT